MIRLVTMTTKRGLITDSFKVVKKSRRGAKQRKSPTPPPSQPEDVTPSAREEDLQQLKQFDLDWRFGPCTGISRLQRWERAKLHGLNPAEEIRELLLQTQADQEYCQSLWRDYPL
ncbi:DNA polymerase delta subunit 4 isoform X2 [Cyprinodon tularosa]|uniref:DNA polymerase delta subunit 4 isoform X2 n=2 Tax=Cyprinodon tularosa TaxID=77115 RepID=UPI0018E21DAD|nr:DNA polymerase delta subunit 4 isoform X2 [Cyprinodon tularosa]